MKSYDQIAMESAATVMLAAEQVEKRIEETVEGKCVKLSLNEARSIVKTFKETASIIDKLGMAIGDKR